MQLRERGGHVHPMPSIDLLTRQRLTRGLLVCLAALAALLLGTACGSASEKDVQGLDDKAAQGGAEFTTLTNVGEPVLRGQLSPDERSFLDSSGATGLIRHLGTLGDQTYYAVGSETGTCFATGSSVEGSPRFSSAYCPYADTAPRFPSPATPIQDFSGFSLDRLTNASYLTRLVGFAADGVKAVGVLDRNGSVHSTQVKSNLYLLGEAPKTPVVAIVAFDASGQEVYRIQLGET